MKPGEKIVAVALVAVGLLVAVGSVFVPKVQVTSEIPVADVMDRQSELLSEAFVAAASEVGKSIVTDEDLFKYLEPKTQAARKDAFSKLDRLIEDRLPRDVNKLKPEAADFLKAIGDEFAKEATKR